MALCAYTTLFKIKLFNFYRLVPHQMSDAGSIMFSSKYEKRGGRKEGEEEGEERRGGRKERREERRGIENKKKKKEVLYFM